MFFVNTVYYLAICSNEKVLPPGEGDEGDYRGRRERGPGAV